MKINIKLMPLVVGAGAFMALSLALLTGHNAFAATKTWTGATDPWFSTPSNWSPAGVPANGDDLVFDDNQLTGAAESPIIAEPNAPVVASITFIAKDMGDGSTSCPKLYAANGIVITKAITVSNSNCVPGLTGGYLLGGDVTISSNSINLGFSDGALDLNGHTLNVSDAYFAEDFLITGQGTINISDNSAFIGHKTYSGTTNIKWDAGGSPLGVIAGNADAFGTSTINVLGTASIYWSIPIANTVISITNPINLYSKSILPQVSMFFGGAYSNSTGLTKLAVPNITLHGNTSLAAQGVMVDLGGIKSNGFCLDYYIGSGANMKNAILDQASDTGFTNGPAQCVAKKNTVGTPNTGAEQTKDKVSLAASLAPFAAIITVAVTGFAIYRQTMNRKIKL